MRRELRKRPVVAAAVAIVAGAGLVVIDRLASRADRIRYEERKGGLVSARDAVLRYERDHRRLPGRLEDLVPRYLRADQLVERSTGQLADGGGAPLYRYDPAKRAIAMASPFAVRGLVSRSLPPVEMDLPRPDTSSGLAARDDAPAATREGERAARPGPLSIVVPSGPASPAPPGGAYVFEAEHYSETNYGWEVHLDPAAAGGAYIHSKEGVANGPGQTMCGVYDFYNIREKSGFTYLKYHFRLPKAGRYYIWGRFWTTGSHCSNAVAAGANEGGPRKSWLGYDGYHGGYISNRTPFRWVWTRASSGPERLAAGDNYLHLFLHEDGLRLDQIALAPSSLGGSKPFTTNLVPNQGTAFADDAPSPVDITFDYGSMVVSADAPPRASVALRRVRACEGDASLRVVLEEAGPRGGELELGTAELALAELPELVFVPVDFSALDFARLPRREFLLRATLTKGGERIAECHVPLMHPFRWEVAGPGRYYSNDTPAPLDGDREKEGVEWTPLAVTKFDHFGVIDFGLQYGGNSLHAPQLKTAYARTRVMVPESGEYLLKIQSDDQMLLWIDGELVYRHDLEAPVTRSVKRLKLVLEAGERRVRMRVNQRAFTEYGDGRWQASLRFRTPDDELSDVRGR
ncbi:MAG: PA14 domain-containing protein [Planctomycetota bacterium]